MEDKIRKVIREQIKKLKEGTDAKQARLLHNMYYSNFHGTTFAEEDLWLHDIDPNSEEDGHEAFLYMKKGTLLTWDNEDETWVDDEGSDIAVDSDQIAYAVDEGMSDEEWADAKEAERLKKHPEKDKINKIKKMMDKEKYNTQPIADFMGKNIDKLKSLKEIATKLGYLKEAINLDIEDDIAILSGDSGEYEGEIEDGKVSFSVIYGDLDYRITDQYDENNIEDFLGKGHAFVELAKKYDYNWDIEPDLVGITIKLGHLNEDNMLQKIEDGVTAITGGGSQHASISDEGDKIKIKFSYARGEFDPEEWAKIINYLEGMGFFILDDSNYYESSYDYEDPPEQVPTIYIKKVDTSAAGLVPGDPDWPGEDDRDNFPNPEDLK